MGLQRESTQARSQLGNSALIAVGLITADQGGLPRYLLAPHQALRTRVGSGPGLAHPLHPLQEQHLVSVIKRLPLDPYASGSAARSRRKASNAPTAAVAAAAGDAYQIANDATGGVRGAPKAASADGAFPTTAVASVGEGDAQIAIGGDTATTADYITVCQATPAVICDMDRAAGDDGSTPFDSDANLDTGSGASSPSISAVSDQTSATATTKDVTDDARRCVRGEELGIHADSRVASAVTTDSVTVARREWAAIRGAPGRLLRVLRGHGGPNRPSRQLPSPTPLAVLRRPPRQSGNRPTLPGMQSDHNSRRSLQKSSSPTAQRRGCGRGDDGTKRDAG